MLYTEDIQDQIRTTKSQPTVELEVPDEVVDAIACRLDVADEPTPADARSVAWDHIQPNFELVTSDGERVTTTALGRAGDPDALDSALDGASD